MSAGEELSKSYSAKEIEQRHYQRWLEEGLFKPRPPRIPESAPYVIAIPPPNVTGSLHMGHALFVTIEDLLIRWQRMCGRETLWIPGVDHAGIATQMVVEQELRKSEGKTRHDLGREKFLERVWEWKHKSGNRIVEQMYHLGASPDWDRMHFTLDADLSRAVRHVFKRLYDEKLIYRDHRLVNWCPRCETVLSDLEADHEESPGSLWHIAYPVSGTDIELVVATTRPETLLGDTAVAVHPDDERYRGLVGKKCRLPLTEREIPIVADGVLVDMAFGSGAVKVTPAHDFNDFETGKRHNLPRLSVLDEKGRIMPQIPVYGGLDRFEARKKMVEDLDAQGLLRKVEPYKVAVAHCQRCETILEPRLSLQWFMKMNAPGNSLVQEPIAAAIDGRIKFYPEEWTKTYLQWMENIQDWCISRQLWWGHRIPVWYCSDCKGETVAENDPSQCEHCASTAIRQDEDTLDTWFSSGLWPFSTLGWPDTAHPDFKRFYPTSVMETGFDILFFWVARMIIMGFKFTGKAPFEKVFLHGMVCDAKGQKMSKTKGNVVDPLDMVQQYGADSLRFTMASMANQARKVNISVDRIKGYAAFCNKIWNAFRFVQLRQAPGTIDEAGVQNDLYNRWIFSRLNRTVQECDRALEEYRFGDYCMAVYHFFWDEFCDWYVEFIKPGEGPVSAAHTAGFMRVMECSLRLLHPVMPFITEELWQKIPQASRKFDEKHTDSIMVAPFPQAGEFSVHEESEATVETAKNVVLATRSLRSLLGIQPQEKLQVRVAAQEKLSARLNQPVMVRALERLANCTLAGIFPPQDFSGTISYTLGNVAVFAEPPVELDREKVAALLKKKLQGNQQELARTRALLANAGFASKSSLEVRQEKERLLKALPVEIQIIERNIRELQGHA